MTDDNRQALAEAVAARRAHRGLSQEVLAARGGPSGRTVRDIENARIDRVTPSTLSKLDRALDWPTNTAAKILAGTATKEEVMEVTNNEPDTASRSSDRQVGRIVAADRLDGIASRVRADVESGRLGVAEGYRLELLTESIRIRLDPATTQLDPALLDELRAAAVAAGLLP